MRYTKQNREGGEVTEITPAEFYWVLYEVHGLSEEIHHNRRDFFGPASEAGYSFRTVSYVYEIREAFEEGHTRDGEEMPQTCPVCGEYLQNKESLRQFDEMQAARALSRDSTFVFLTVKGDGKIYANETQIKSMEDWEQFEKGLEESGKPYRVSCSSSMDFPRDYTDDPDTIALVNKLR